MRARTPGHTPGRAQCSEGRLTMLSPHSGHYVPTQVARVHVRVRACVHTWGEVAER